MKQNIEKIETLYNEMTLAEGYPHLYDEEYIDILHHSPLLREPGKKVLDIGCGVGIVSQVVKKLGHHTTGVDLSKAAIEEALRLKRLDEGHVVDIFQNQFKPGSFDVVLCVGVLLHIFELEKLFTEVHRLLKPGGQVLVYDHHLRNPYVKLHFSRPDIVDRILEGRSNAARRPFDESILRKAGGNLFRWSEPDFISVFTRHPNTVINSVHNVARAAFRGIRRYVTTAPWTGNMIVMTGTKSEN